jgi:hypothetical protein
MIPLTLFSHINVDMQSKVFYKVVLTSLLLLFIFKGNTQSKRVVTPYTNAWIVYAGTHKIGPKWSIMPEVQWRRNDIFAKPLQIIFRPGIMYHINDNTSLAAGYLYAITDPVGEKPTFPENRTWQQLQTKINSGIVEIVNRFRLEQRWVNNLVLTGTTYAPGDPVYSNRMRMMHKFSMPLNSKTITNKTIYAVIFDEMFLQWSGQNASLYTFDQNRAFFGLGYRVPKFGRIELGYLNQYVFKGSSTVVENNHNITLWALSNIDFYKKKTEK